METVQHFLLQCRNHEEARKVLIAKVRSRVGKLLGDKKRRDFPCMEEAVEARKFGEKEETVDV
jgi:hypothetical protein